MEIGELRRQIDCIDEELVRLFVRRMDVVTQVAADKKASHRSVGDRAREEEILRRAERRAGAAYGPYVRQWYEKMFELSRRYQSALMDESDSAEE